MAWAFVRLPKSRYGGTCYFDSMPKETKRRLRAKNAHAAKVERTMKEQDRLETRIEDLQTLLAEKTVLLDAEVR